MHHFYNAGDFAFCSLLENAFADVLSNFRCLREPLPSFDEGPEGFNPYNTQGKWKNFVFRWEGEDNEVNLARCPVVKDVLNRIPDLARFALFSVLLPGAYLEAHSGPNDDVLTVQLALEVPRGTGCQLRSGDDWRGWQPGQCLVFDDYYDHEVVNHTDEARAVLLLDVWKDCPTRLVRVGDVVRVSPEYYVRDSAVPQEGVVTSFHSVLYGAVMAVVGGTSYPLFKLQRVTQV